MPLAGRRPAQQALGGAIGQFDAAIGGDDDHAGRRAGRQVDRRPCGGAAQAGCQVRYQRRQQAYGGRLEGSAAGAPS
jgi:hypothetical protein